MPDFHPSPAQQRLLDCALDHPGCPSVGALCRLSRTPRSTYYFWHRDPAFRAWFTSAWSAQLLFDGIPLLNLARARAQHDFRYWKVLSNLIFDPRGLAPLRHWQEALVTAPVQQKTQQNQPLPAASLDKKPARRSSHFPPRPTLRNHIRWLQRGLGALHRAARRRRG